MSPIVWSETARRDLGAIVARIVADNPEAAERVATAILETIERLAEFPHLGRPGRRTGTRELVVVAFPIYLIVYRISGVRIGIARILHTRRAWPR